MDGEQFDSVTYAVAAALSRRGVLRGILGVALVRGLFAWPASTDAAKKKRKKKKKRKPDCKKKGKNCQPDDAPPASPPVSPPPPGSPPAAPQCPAGCPQNETCSNGACVCAAPNSKIFECSANAPNEYTDDHCEGSNPPLLVCCPSHRVYAACPNELIVDGFCQDDGLAPSVCCPEAKVCGKRCCEKFFRCENGACTGKPGSYQRVRRPS